MVKKDLSKDRLRWHHVEILFWVVNSSEKNQLVTPYMHTMYVTKLPMLYLPIKTTRKYLPSAKIHDFLRKPMHFVQIVLSKQQSLISHSSTKPVLNWWYRNWLAHKAVLVMLPNIQCTALDVHFINQNAANLIYTLRLWCHKPLKSEWRPRPSQG